MSTYLGKYVEVLPNGEGLGHHPTLSRQIVNGDILLIEIAAEDLLGYRVDTAFRKGCDTFGDNWQVIYTGFVSILNQDICTCETLLFGHHLGCPYTKGKQNV
ncbi:MAG: hypothetical protein KGI50_05865 [Patescibacteria group bacterium]|nr:hypothetical protein [Patescibacteria group bacterium]MDE2438802.1 hypothetical protein [Patescibacteria group bacterium]